MLSPNEATGTSSLSSTRHEQIRERRAVGGADVPAAFEPAGAAAREQHRQRVVIVLIRIRHAAAVHDQRVIEQAAVAVGRVGELAQEIRDRGARVVLVELREPLDVRGNPRVVRRVVEALVHAAARIQPVAELARDHERRDAREIGRPREREQVEHQHRVLFEVGRECRSACRAPRRRRARSPRRARGAARARARRSNSGPCARGPRPGKSRCSAATWPVTESSRLESCRCRAARSSGVLPSPSRRSNTTRGFVSIGNGVCGVRYEIDEPASSASSSDGSGVSWPMCCAAS